MKLKPYPDIEGVEFREIPKSALNINSSFEYPLEKYPDDLFHGYAISSNKVVWYGRGRPWGKVAIENNSEPEVVVLHFFGLKGALSVAVDALYEHVFGEHENA